MDSLAYKERRPADESQGLLVLHHGRGTDEHDLLRLADGFDPERRLHVVTPRAPLVLPGSPGRHWYVVPRVGYPDHDTFHAALAALSAFHDGLWRETGLGPAQTVLGGFSMGAVMSYAMGLSAKRPAVAGILAFGGFVPRVDDWRPNDDDWRPSLEDRQRTRAFIAHGRNDPVIGIDFARSARELLAAGGLEVEYHESEVGHQIDPAHLAAAADWLRVALPG